jgi:hypothetical protein
LWLLGDAEREAEMSNANTVLLKVTQRERQARWALASAVLLIGGACALLLTALAHAGESASFPPLIGGATKSVPNAPPLPSPLLPGINSPTALATWSPTLSSTRTTSPLSAEPLFAHPAPTASNTLRDAPNACKGDSAVVCYDYRSGRAVMPITQSLMPTVPGLKPEGITLKRDKMAFNYSF